MTQIKRYEMNIMRPLVGMPIVFEREDDNGQWVKYKDLDDMQSKLISWMLDNQELKNKIKQLKEGEGHGKGNESK